MVFLVSSGITLKTWLIALDLRVKIRIILFFLYLAVSVSRIIQKHKRENKHIAVTWINRFLFKMQNGQIKCFCSENGCNLIPSHLYLKSKPSIEWFNRCHPQSRTAFLKSWCLYRLFLLVRLIQPDIPPPTPVFWATHLLFWDAA